MGYKLLYPNTESSRSVLHCSSRLSILLPAFQSLPLVVKLFSPPHGKLKFGIPSREVNFERNQGKPFLIGLYRDLPDLLAIQKQSSWPDWINVKAVCCFVWAYVKVVQPHFSGRDSGESVLERYLSGTKRFHLRSPELESSLVRV